MNPAEQLSFLVFGAGAIGAYVGGSLALSGSRVAFLEQPELAESLAQRGIRLKIKGEERRLPDPLTAGSVEAALTFGPFDAAIFALKSFDTAPALEGLKPYAVDLPTFLCLQNGVDNEPLLAGALGADKVIAGTVTSAVGRRGLGDVVLEKRRGMGLAGGHSLSRPLLAALNRAGLNAFLYPQGGSMKWSKLVANLLGNASSAILNMSPGDIFAHPGLFRLEKAQLREALRVVRGLGYQAVNLPGTPVRLLAWAVSLPDPISRPLLGRAVGGGRGAKMPSFHIDLHSGRGRSEVEYLNGAVVRYGEQVDVKAPVNRLLTERLVALTKGEIPLEMYAGRPERLLTEWKDQQ
jgi:2-dehydropantoate 2-reductase